MRHAQDRPSLYQKERAPPGRALFFCTDPGVCWLQARIACQTGCARVCPLISRLEASPTAAWLRGQCLQLVGPRAHSCAGAGRPRNLAWRSLCHQPASAAVRSALRSLTSVALAIIKGAATGGPDPRALSTREPGAARAPLECRDPAPHFPGIP